MLFAVAELLVGVFKPQKMRMVAANVALFLLNEI